jgi:capsular exopolysaccharide synthesis family protein
MRSTDHRSEPAAPEAEGALGPYLRALAGHRTLVVFVTLAAVAASVAWLSARMPAYEATAQLLVTPLPQDDRTFLGLQMIRDSGDPTRTVQTAAALMKSEQAAALTAQRLGSDWSARRVAAAVDVEPVGESNILAVSARWRDAVGAARLANEFTDAALRSRSIVLREQIDAAFTRLREQVRALRRNGAAAGAELAQLQQLHTLRAGPDPTLSLSQRAVAPASPSGAPPWLVVAMALLAGFTLAIGAALFLDHLNRRIRDSDEAVDVLGIDVLARVPLLGERQRRAAASAPGSTPPAVQEAFRTLAVQLQLRTGGSGTVMITSASSGDGKTTSAINLAFALVAAGRRVILMDFDLRKPDVADVLGIRDRPGLTSLLKADMAVADLLVQTPQLPPLRVVPAGSRGETLMLEPLTRRLADIVEQARSAADYLILDTPPLGEVGDALRVAAHADQILVVTRPAHTDRGRLELMRDLLVRGGTPPSGMIVLGEHEPLSPYYAYGVRSTNGHVPQQPPPRPPVRGRA